MSLLVGGYLPRDTWLHRLHPGVKLVATALTSIAIVVVRDWVAGGVFLAAALGLAVAARLPVSTLLKAARGILLLAVVLSALQGWLDGWEKAVETLLDLVALVLLGVVLTSTTSVNALLDTLLAVLRPLRRLGVDPDRVALTFGMAIQAMPATVALAVETRDAARARGIRHPRAYLTPFVIRVVARAHETGAALHARGIADD